MFYKMLPPKPMANVWEVNNPAEQRGVVEPRPDWWLPDDQPYPLDNNGGLVSGYEAQAIACWDYSNASSMGPPIAYEYRVLTPPVLPQT